MMQIIRLIDKPEYKDKMANWFHEKWGVPLEAYLESMEECLTGGYPVPSWYIAEDNGDFVGGLGVIENDFHDRKDLAPNVCAVYVEEAYRKQGIAGQLLNFVVEDMKKEGVSPLYLVTDHTGFYERYGWEYYCPALGDGEDEPCRLYIHR